MAKYLRIQDVAEMFKVSIRTIYNWIDFDGFPKPRKIGGVAFWEEKDITKWVSKNT